MGERRISAVSAVSFLESSAQHVTHLPEEPPAHQVKLYRVTKVQREVKVFEVPVERASLSECDAFYLDAGEKIYMWFGKKCTPFEKSFANMNAENIECERGICETTHDCDDAFWDL